MGKLSRSVRRKTMPVETGAGRIRMETATPECRPTPEAWTGRWTVVSKRKWDLRVVHGRRKARSYVASVTPLRNLFVVNCFEISDCCGIGTVWGGVVADLRIRKTCWIWNRGLLGSV